MSSEGEWKNAASKAAARREYERQRGELGPCLEKGGVPKEDAAKALSLVRDTIAIEVSRSAKSLARAGGSPDLPSPSAWPTGASGPLDFVAQIPLEEVTRLDIHERLPARGLLSFFVKHVVDDASGELALEAAVLCLDRGEALSPQKPPKGAWKSKAQSLVFRAQAELPPYGSRLFQGDRVDGRYKKVYDMLYSTRRPRTSQAMLCFDRPFEAKLDADEVILLRIDKGGDIAYSFEELSVVYFIISEKDLAARRFDAVRVIEGGTI